MGADRGPTISLRTGGGALRGIGETFTPDLRTGIGNYRIPTEVQNGQAGLQPSLALAYGTGGPNEAYGLGWSLSVPGVRRKTSGGVPRYDGTDAFVLSGAEDRVPVPAGPGVPADAHSREAASCARGSSTDWAET